MPDTPLCDALRAFANANPLRLHMPGHKGKALPLPELAGYAALDFTELPPTGDLFSPGGPIEAAENLWAQACEVPACLFLTGGSTQGVHAALALTCRPGQEILLDRGSHRSAYNALALLDLKPIYLSRPWLDGAEVTGPLSPQAVEKALEDHPNAKTICITSPTYYGVLSDIAAIAAIAHARGAKLVVDGAHGAHLPFLGENPFRGADLVTLSAHKTLPAPGQTALLLSGGAYSLEDLRWGAALYGTSSPSYPLMAALDAARAYLEGRGGEEYLRVAERTAALRREFFFLPQSVPQDPTRFVFRCGDGFAAQAALEAQGIYPEMADRGHVVFILTCADDDGDLDRLAAALRMVRCEGGGCFSPPPLPEQVCSPREALFSPRNTLPLRDAEGLVSAVQIAPYPPGVPVIAPGERIGKKQLSYLREMGYNINHRIGVL